jgi:hypothetical protein
MSTTQYVRRAIGNFADPVAINFSGVRAAATPLTNKAWQRGDESPQLMNTLASPPQNCFRACSMFDVICGNCTQ